MNKYGHETRISALLVLLHFLSALLCILKIFGGIQNLEWWIIAFPFIIDLVVFLFLLFCAGVLFVMSLLFNNNK